MFNLLIANNCTIDTQEQRKLVGEALMQKENQSQRVTGGRVTRLIQYLFNQMDEIFVNKLPFQAAQDLLFDTLREFWQ